MTLALSMLALLIGFVVTCFELVFRLDLKKSVGPWIMVVSFAWLLMFGIFSYAPAAEHSCSVKREIIAQALANYVNDPKNQNDVQAERAVDATPEDYRRMAQAIVDAHCPIKKKRN